MLSVVCEGSRAQWPPAPSTTCCYTLNEEGEADSEAMKEQLPSIPVPGVALSTLYKWIHLSLTAILGEIR